MMKIQANIRKVQSKKTKVLREQGLIPCVLYGPKIKNQILEVNARSFQQIYAQAGESSIITLEVKNDKKSKDFLILIKDVIFDPVSDKIIHIDFYQPILDKEVNANVVLVFTGEAPVVKNLGGVLLKNISEIEVIALPKNLPSKISVGLDVLETLDSVVLVKDLLLPENVKVLRDLNDVVVSVSAPRATKEEVAKDVEESEKEKTTEEGQEQEKSETTEQKK